MSIRIGGDLTAIRKAFKSSKDITPLLKKIIKENKCDVVINVYLGGIRNPSAIYNKHLTGKEENNNE